MPPGLSLLLGTLRRQSPEICVHTQPQFARNFIYFCVSTKLNEFILIFLTTGFIHTPPHSIYFLLFSQTVRNPAPIIYNLFTCLTQVYTEHPYEKQIYQSEFCVYEVFICTWAVLYPVKIVSQGFDGHLSAPFFWCYVVHSWHRRHWSPFAPRVLQPAGWFPFSLHTVKFTLGGVVLWVLTNASNHVPTPTASQRSSVALKIPSCNPFEVKSSPSPKH